MTTTNVELKEFKNKLFAEAQTAKQRFGWQREIDEILARLDVTAPDPLDTEPSRGSIVRHATNSTVYVRAWGKYNDGDANWKSSQEDATTLLSWTQVRAESAPAAVVVLVDTKGAQAYDEVR